MSDNEQYDQDYSKTVALFGEEPDPLLVDFHARIAKQQPVLDVGAGQGRHALYLARLGYRVDAIDPSSVGIDQLREGAYMEGLKVSAEVVGWEQYRGDARDYGAVLLFGLIQLLTRSQIDALNRRSLRWLAPGGLLFVTGHTTDDEGCKMRASDSSWSLLEEDTFVGPEGQLRTYLRPGEVLERFADFDVVHHREGLGPEHRHGDAPPERHACVRALLRKR